MGATEVPTTQLVVHLADNPLPTAKTYKVVANIDSVNHARNVGKIRLFIQQDSVAKCLQYDDCIRLTASPQLPNSGTDSLRFDYRRYLRHKGVLWQAYVPAKDWVKLSAESETRSIVSFAKRLQLRLVSRIRGFNLTESQQHIAEALVLGWRNDVGPSMQKQFRDAGVSHLLCVSGLHVGLFASIVGGCLFFLGRGTWQRVVKGILQIIAIWAFVLISGLSPSATRAGLMFSLMLLGGMVERRTSSLNNLATSALVLLVANPMVLFDIGFQLSYAAVLGIIAWYQPLRRLLSFSCENDIPWYAVLWNKVWSWICISTVAQLASLPLLLYHFHQFPVYFLVTNLLVVPVAGVLLFLVLLMTLFRGWLAPTVGGLIGYIDSTTRWVSSFPSAVLDNLYCDVPMAVMLLLAILLFTLFVRCRRHWALPSAVACLVMFFGYAGVSGKHAAMLQGQLSAQECDGQIKCQGDEGEGVEFGPDGADEEHEAD